MFLNVCRYAVHLEREREREMFIGIIYIHLPKNCIQTYKTLLLTFQYAVHTFINYVFLKNGMEEKTTLIFKGRLSEFDTWLEVMKNRYPKAFIEVVLEDFNNTE